MCLAYDPRLKLQQWLLEAQLPKTLARNESIMCHRADARRKKMLVCLLLVHVVGEGRGQAGAVATSAAVDGPISSFVFELRQHSGGGHSLRIASAAARLAPKSGVPIPAASNTNPDDEVGSSGTGATKAANERKGKAVSARSASDEVQSNLEPAIQNQREIETGLVQALQGLRVSPRHTSQIRGTRSDSVKSTDCNVRARGKQTRKTVGVGDSKNSTRRRRSRQIVSTPMIPGNYANTSAGNNSINRSSTVAPSSRAVAHMLTDTARDEDSNEAEDKVERERAQVGTTSGAEREETEGGGGGRVEENQDGAGALTGGELNTSRFLPSRGRVVGKTNRYSLVLLMTVCTHDSPACTTYHVTHINESCHTYK